MMISRTAAAVAVVVTACGACGGSVSADRSTTAHTRGATSTTNSARTSELGARPTSTSTATQSTGPSDLTGIRRATSTSQPRSGHFSDPYPLSGSTDPRTSSGLVFSGTFPEILTCHGALRPGCFVASTISVGFDPLLRHELAWHGDESNPATKAHHIYRGAGGHWDMIVTSKITRGNEGWNVILHARPTAVHGSAVPTSWEVDAVLVGSLDHPAAANYDGKLYDDNGRLYLVYSGAVSLKPQIFGVVARRMATPSRVASGPPVTLLAPDRADGGLNSENRFGPDQHDGFKLVETGNIAKINGKYVMVYAVGAFDRPDYKIGVAYSDTFLPTGAGYRKVRMPDPTGVWGRKGADEVRYLLQSEEVRWPDYARSRVQAPGVGSLVHTDGHWYLFFAGYAPSERPSASTGKFEASHRQPYYVPVRLDVPAHPSVSAASNSALARWIVVGLGS